MCWTHGLYDAIIYIYTRGLGDYGTPLREILRVIQSAVRNATKVGFVSFPILIASFFTLSFFFFFKKKKKGFGAADELRAAPERGRAASGLQAAAVH